MPAALENDFSSERGGKDRFTAHGAEFKINKYFCWLKLTISFRRRKRNMMEFETAAAAAARTPSGCSGVHNTGQRSRIKRTHYNLNWYPPAPCTSASDDL